MQIRKKRVHFLCTAPETNCAKVEFYVMQYLSKVVNIISTWIMAGLVRVLRSNCTLRMGIGRQGKRRIMRVVAQLVKPHTNFVPMHFL